MAGLVQNWRGELVQVDESPFERACRIVAERKASERAKRQPQAISFSVSVCDGDNGPDSSCEASEDGRGEYSGPRRFRPGNLIPWALWAIGVATGVLASRILSQLGW